MDRSLVGRGFAVWPLTGTSVSPPVAAALRCLTQKPSFLRSFRGVWAFWLPRLGKGIWRSDKGRG